MLPDGQYAIYDYWNQKFLGVFEKSVTIHLAPCDSAVLRISPVKNDVPTLVSSSRHITQGGYELVEYSPDAKKKQLRGKVKCVGGEPEKLTFLLPEDMQIKAVGGTWTQKDNTGILTLLSDKNCEAAWSLEWI